MKMKIFVTFAIVFSALLANAQVSKQKVLLEQQGRLVGNSDGVRCYTRIVETTEGTQTSRTLHIFFQSAHKNIELDFRADHPLKNGDEIKELGSTGIYRYQDEAIYGSGRNPTTGYNMSVQVTGVSPRLSSIRYVKVVVDNRRDRFDVPSLRIGYACAFSY